jgi:cell division septal protein FtsQ
MKAFRNSLLIFCLIATAIGVYLALNPQWIRIQTVTIEMPASSHEDLLFQRIRTSLAPQFQHLIGKYFWQVPLSQVYDVVAHDRRVRKVSIYREFPNGIRIEVEPHTPVLAYLSSDNRFYPVAKDATLLPALPVADVADLPIIRGEDLKDEPHLRELAIELFDQIPSEGVLNKNAISEIFYSKKDGFKIFINSADRGGGGGSEVKIGDSDFSPKLSRVEKVLSYLESQNVKGRVIDARFSKKVVVRVRNNP